MDRVIATWALLVLLVVVTTGLVIMSYKAISTPSRPSPQWETKSIE